MRVRAAMPSHPSAHLSTEGNDMTIRSIVVWEATPHEAFVERYTAEHVPLVRALPGLEGLTVSPLRSRSHSLMAELEFAGLDDMKGAFTSPQGEALMVHTRDLESAFGIGSTNYVVLPPLSLD